MPSPRLPQRGYTSRAFVLPPHRRAALLLQTATDYEPRTPKGRGMDALPAAR